MMFMKNRSSIGQAFGAFLIIIGTLNLVLVHPVPGIVYFLLSFIYFPPADDLLKKIFGKIIPPVFRFILGFVIIWFTLGISDLGDMID